MTLKDEIFKLLKDKYPDIDLFHFDNAISDMIDYASKMNETNRSFWLDYTDHKRVNSWDNIREQMEYDILEQDIGYDCTMSKDNFSDYQKGVCAAIGLIEHRIHCICDL